MIQEPGENMNMVDEIEVLLQLGWSAGAIRQKLSARGFDGPNIDRIIAFSFRDLYSEKLTLDDLQHARNEREQAEEAEQDALLQKQHSDNMRTQEDADALLSWQNEEATQAEERKQSYLDEERRLEDEDKRKNAERVEADHQISEEKKSRQDEQGKRLREITMY
jgi:hypothetical protein